MLAFPLNAINFVKVGAMIAKKTISSFPCISMGVPDLKLRLHVSQPLVLLMPPKLYQKQPTSNAYEP